MSLISFSHVSKRFGKNVVLKDITFDVVEGECLALVGRSGCGKSTLLKVLLGLYAADSGTITYSGKRIDNTALRQLTGYASQENSFYDTLTVRENILYYASRMRTSLSGRRATELAASVRLDNAMDVLAGQLSGGMKRRLDLALSLVHDPALLILDEPTTGLDPALVDEFWKLAAAMLRKGKTVMVVTHNLEDVKRNCNKAVVMKNGTVSDVTTDMNTIRSAFRRFA